MHTLSQFNGVAQAITGNNGESRTARLDCVETYALTLHSSEFFVPENHGLVQPKRKDGGPTELSTVLRGMARNNCGEPLHNVRIHMKVADAAGKRGDGWASVGTLERGEVKPFERAWMGRVTTYEVTEIR